MQTKNKWMDNVELMQAMYLQESPEFIAFVLEKMDKRDGGGGKEKKWSHFFLFRSSHAAYSRTTAGSVLNLLM